MKPAPPPEPTAELFADAAARQLRDLRLLRRLVPVEARVVFALQPLALYTDKELSSEEEALFEALDVLQPRRWPELKRMLETFWGAYAATLQEGCAATGIPFVDLSRGRVRGLVLRRPRAHDRPRARRRGCDAGADGDAMKILDWLRGDDSDDDEQPEEEPNEEEVPGDEDDPTTYPLW